MSGRWTSKPTDCSCEKPTPTRKLVGSVWTCGEHAVQWVVTAGFFPGWRRK